MSTDRITKATLERLQRLQDELNIFHGMRQIWAQGVANHRQLPLSLDELMREQLQQLGHIAAFALDAHQTVYPGRSPHMRFAYVRDPRTRPESRVVESIPRLPDVAAITREVAEQGMGCVWHPRHPEPALPGGDVAGPVYEVPEVRANPFHRPGEVYRPALSFQPINALGGLDDEALAHSSTLEIVGRMAYGHGFWCQMQTPFTLSDGLYWAGFTPDGTTGWNGTPDHWTGSPSLGLSVCLAALAAVAEKARRADEPEPDQEPGA